MAAACALGGCTVHPSYQRPALDVQPRWANATSALRPAGDAAPGIDTGWWRQLGDPAINQLVAQAMATNPTLGEVLARIDQAGAQLGTDRAAQLPQIDLTASASRAQIGVTETTGAGLSIRPIRQSAAAAGPSLSWEIDLWGRLRQQRAAAQHRLEARIADADAARLSIAAQVADTVIVLRACKLSLTVRDSDLASRNRELAIARQRLAFGSIAPADVAGAETNLANARTDQIAIRASCMRSMDALVALSGSDTDAVETALAAGPVGPAPRTKAGSNQFADLAGEDDLPKRLPVPPEASLALPATVLLRQPGVIAAEREIAARWNEIGVARADRLPRLNLSAVLTGQWLSALGSKSSFSTWSVGPDMIMPLFDGGSRKATVRMMQARYRESWAAMNGTLRAAARDVEDALADQQSAAARVGTSGQAVTAALFTMRANDARWRAGAISAFDLETSRRALNTARENAVAAARDRARAWVALVRSTGGTIEGHAPATPANQDRTPS
jgi:NodT family efflux transporter outer membrane factor (OMF) lipoprotein